MKNITNYKLLIISLAGLSNGISVGAVIYGFGTFVNHFIALGWTVVAINSGPLVGIILQSLVSRKSGELIDKYGFRKVNTLALFLMAIGFLCLSLTTQVWMWWLGWGLVYSGYSTTTLLQTGKVVGSWINPKNRGKVIGMITIGNNIFGFIMMRISLYIGNKFGFNNSLLIYAGIFLLLALCYGTWMRENKQPLRKVAYAYPVKSIDIVPITLVIVFSYWTYPGVLQNLIPALVAEGNTYPIVSQMMLAVAILASVSKILFGWSSEKETSQYALLTALAIQTIALLFFFINHFYSLFYGYWIFIILYAIGFGSIGALIPLIIIEYYGTRIYGSVYGKIQFFYVIPGVIAPLVAGFSYDCFHSYALAFLLTAIILLLGLIILTKLKKIYWVNILQQIKQGVKMRINQGLLLRLQADDSEAGQKISLLFQYLGKLFHEANLTEKEIGLIIENFLAMVRMSSEEHNEFILFTNVFGFDTLLTYLEGKRGLNNTPTTLMGPAHLGNGDSSKHPARDLGANIDDTNGSGIPLYVSGYVLDATSNQPIVNALVDTWSTDENGNYGGLHYTEAQPTVSSNLRGVFRTNNQGEFFYKTVVPHHYSAPMHGPIGQFLKLLNRTGNRPAHMHFIVRAEGYYDCITHLFPQDDPDFDKDVTFQVLVPGTQVAFSKYQDGFQMLHNFRLVSQKYYQEELPDKDDVVQLIQEQVINSVQSDNQRVNKITKLFLNYMYEFCHEAKITSQDLYRIQLYLTDLDKFTFAELVNFCRFSG
ncbi:MAG: MFS transporter [Stigonema ocellatum SAG 48.90 = DSM 106950]|nr:MFS transporter [Stigonema ocellatum SAG 48.90 = DSM 106950]